MITIYILLFGVIAAAFLVSLYNLITAPVLNNNGNKINDDFVSVLIPARNEVNKIGNTIKRLINQNYYNLEIIVLDDNSSDGTAEEVQQLRQYCNKIKLIKGRTLPGGWTGKNWACYQLAEKANGEYLLFIDADVLLEKNAINNAVKIIKNISADLLSIFPTQLMHSTGEKLVVPMMNWLLLSFLPLRLVFNSSQKSFSAANGQFMLWKREAYFKIGGHEPVKNKIVEDMELARLAKYNRLKMLTLLGGDSVFCRMYNTFSSAVNGYLKNFYPGFNTGRISFSVLIVLLFLSFNMTILFAFFNKLMLTGVVLIFLNRIFISVKSRQPVMLNLFYHPVQFFLLLFIGINSAILFNKQKIMWKNRFL